MKFLGKHFVFIIPLLIPFYVVFGRINSSDGEIEKKIALLKEFYLAYNAVWGSYSDFEVIVYQLDSMRQKYCSEKFILELNEKVETYGYSFDEIIGDVWADDKYLQDLSVTEDKSRVDWFIVSYIGIIEKNSKPVEIDVKLQVEVVEENDSYRINDVQPIR